MAHHEIQTLTDLAVAAVPLEDQLSPLEQQRGLGRVLLGGKLIETAVEVFGNTQIHGHTPWYQTSTKCSRSAKILSLDLFFKQQHQTLSPVLTAIAFINWWEGRGSKAHQFLELALDADPGYRLAKLNDMMIGTGMVAGWSMDKEAAYREWG